MGIIEFMNTEYPFFPVATSILLFVIFVGIWYYLHKRNNCNGGFD